MKDLAINKHGCKEFTSVTEGTQELGQTMWYNSSIVQVKESLGKDALHAGAPEPVFKAWMFASIE